MAFKKGQSKPATSGRKKNQVARLFTLREGLALAGFDIAKELRKLLDHPDATIDQKLAVLNTMLRYTHAAPAPQKVEEDTESQNGVILDAEYQDLNDEELAKLAKGD